MLSRQVSEQRHSLSFWTLGLSLLSFLFQSAHPFFHFTIRHHRVFFLFKEMKEFCLGEDGPNAPWTGQMIYYHQKFSSMVKSSGNITVVSWILGHLMNNHNVVGTSSLFKAKWDCTCIVGENGMRFWLSLLYKTDFFFFALEWKKVTDCYCLGQQRSYTLKSILRNFVLWIGTILGPQSSVCSTDSGEIKFHGSLS